MTTTKITRFHHRSCPAGCSPGIEDTALMIPPSKVRMEPQFNPKKIITVEENYSKYYHFISNGKPYYNFY